MKKHLKKLMAVFMAAAMTLSLSLTAFATGEEAENVARTLPTQGSADGSSSTEGPLPSDPVEVVLPVVPTPGDGEMGMFDLILDPHNLINKTEGARYAVQGVTKTFAEDQKMYFLSSSSDTAQTFGAQ